MTTIKTKVKTFKDVDLTFQMNPLTKDVAIKFDADAIKQSLRNLILTMNYERPFHPEIGSPAYSLLFELASPVTATVLQTVITQTINTFEPRVRLNFVDVRDDSDNNAYQVNINFSIASFYQDFEVTLLLQKLR